MKTNIKRIIPMMLATSMLLLLTGCQLSEKDYIASLGEESDGVHLDFDGNHQEVVTDKGVFGASDSTTMSSEGGFYSMMHYVDFETGKETPLCDKVNCSHNTESCNALIGEPVMQIYPYGKYMYVIAMNQTENARSLYRISYDGSEKEELMKLAYLDEYDIGQPSSYSFIVYKGYGYLVQNNTVENTSKEYGVTLQRIRLEKNGKVEDLATMKGVQVSLTLGVADDNGIYLHYSYMNNMSSREMVYNNLYYDTNTDKITQIDEIDGKAVRHIDGDKLYYYYLRGTADDGSYRVYNKKDKSDKEIFNCGHLFSASYDEKYTYLDTYDAIQQTGMDPAERKIYVLDDEDNLVDTYEGLNDSCVVAIRDGRVLIVEAGEEGDTYTVRDFNN